MEYVLRPMLQHPSAYAASAPDRPAIIMSTGEVCTYGELDARSNRIAQLLRKQGLGVGDHIAILLENRVEFLEVLWGGLRAGVYVTPINWHLNAEEAGYIVNDCGASLLFASSELLPMLGDEVALPDDRRIAVGGDVPGLANYESLLDAFSDKPIADQCEGSFMLYSSGTTGRPKGIKPPVIGNELGAPNTFTALMSGLYGFGEESVYLCPAPLYHAAPIGWTTGAHRLGSTAVVMERFDPLETLALVERHRITHVQFVPTHMIRLLKLSDEERSRFDLSSLQSIIHAAAPCPVDVKRAFIEWVGPIVHEYYSGSEGVGFCAINSEEWLAHPGSVGRSLMGPVHVVDEDGTELGPNQEGQIWFEPPGTFEYHGDPEKTESAFNDRGWGSLGDVGWVDEEGFLFLTDRVSNMIISGGVNIYPREIEDILQSHPAVEDVAVIGVPHPEMGEAVRAVVQLNEPATGDDALERELIEYCRARATHYKCPTSVAFVPELPRLPTGKLAKRLLDDSVRI
jgi:acyl-CoA synthetase (AMP-forming)/AMP-acid ligase II